jgi:predicted DNA-binding transcriptional regulator AlpA
VTKRHTEIENLSDAPLCRGVVVFDDLLVLETQMRTEREAAKFLGLAAATLRSWRCRGIGPAYVKMGPGPKSPVRYNRADIDAWVAQCRHVPPVRAAFEEPHGTV